MKERARAREKGQERSVEIEMRQGPDGDVSWRRCRHVAAQHIQPQRKLIPLYVMDSIIKNVGNIYTRLMMTNLVNIFWYVFVHFTSVCRGCVFFVCNA